jgi:Terminase small subunit
VISPNKERQRRWNREAAKPPRARAKGDLTQKQELFCLAFIQTGNASEAYRRAYAASRMAGKTVHECASRVLADRKVSARVAELRAEAAERAKVSASEVVASLARDIRFDPARLFHQNGRPKQLHELDAATRLALRVEVDVEGKIKYRSPDKAAAREQPPEADRGAGARGGVSQRGVRADPGDPQGLSSGPGSYEPGARPAVENPTPSGHQLDSPSHRPG